MQKWKKSLHVLTIERDKSGRIIDIGFSYFGQHIDLTNCRVTGHLPDTLAERLGEIGAVEDNGGEL